MTWTQAQSPFVLGNDAVKGGPGNGPKPDSPLYVCRVYDNNAIVPGKWVEGECHYVNDQGKEGSSKTYEVATGPAEWRNFDGSIGALVPGGYLADGTNIYICRKQISYFGSKKGYQPGFLANGKCHIPYGVDIIEGTPFDALYNSAPPQQQQLPPAPPSGPAQPHGILISFPERDWRDGGHGDCDKRLYEQHGHQTAARQLNCAAVHGNRTAGCFSGWSTDSGPAGWRSAGFGTNNAVNVTQASISVSQF